MSDLLLRLNCYKKICQIRTLTESHQMRFSNPIPTVGGMKYLCSFNLVVRQNDTISKFDSGQFS